MRMLRVFAGISGVIVACLAPAAASAQIVCDYCSYVGGKHKFSGITCQKDDPGCFDCSGTPEGHIGCHAAEADGECGEGHNVCGGASLAEAQVLDAVRTRNAARLATVVLANKNVHFNIARGALQIVGCTGALTSHVPLDSEMEAALRREYVVRRLPMTEWPSIMSRVGALPVAFNGTDASMGGENA